MASGQPPGTDPLQSWSNNDKTSLQQKISALDTGGNNANVIRESSVQQQGGSPMGQQMILNDEEKQVMRECETESLYKRALPLSCGAMLAAQMLVKSGRWQPNPKYGALPKLIVCGGIGYITGKILYLPICQEKILQKIPHSNLAAAIRKAKGIPEPESQIPTGWEQAPSSGGKLRDEYSSSATGPDLDDRFRPSMDREVKVREAPEQEIKPRTSYEELRRRNREEYENSKRSGSHRPSANTPNRDSLPQKPWLEGDDPPAAPSPPPEQPQKKKRTNIWGDPIE